MIQDFFPFDWSFKKNGNPHMIFICALFVLVKEKLAHDPDSEIATTCLRVSLTCPVSSNQIRCNQFAVNQDKTFS